MSFSSLDTNGPWLLKNKNTIYCLPLKVSKHESLVHKESQYIQNAIVLFQNKYKAIDFKNFHISKNLTNQEISYNISKDFPEECVSDFEMNINVKNEENSLLVDDIINNTEFNPESILDIDNDTIILYSIFAHSIYFYIDEIITNNNNILLKGIVINPFSNKILSDDTHTQDDIKNDIIINHLEYLYNQSI